VHHCHNPQWLLLRRVSDDVISGIHETQRPRSEIGAAVALLRKRNKRLDSRLNLVDGPIGGIEIVRRYLFPNIVEVDFSFLTKVVPRH
jgi:hypothetical protein